MKYVHCTHNTLVKSKYKDADGAEQEIIFYPFVMNKYTGTPSSTGYTPIKEDVLELVQKQSKVFQAYTKQGYLKVVDKMPVTAENAASLLQQKSIEVAELTQKLAAAEAKIAELEKGIAKKASAKTAEKGDAAPAQF